jgi:hypothetical protein
MKQSILVVAFIAVVSLLFAAGLYAGTKAAAEIDMKAAYEHTKGIVKFTHQKHVTTHKVACGECHHDDKGKPLTGLKDGDPVKKCFDCHNKPGELKGKKAEGLSKAEKLMYHANALHDNCIECHKKFNKDNKTTTAPDKCNDCHPKDK